MIIITRHDTAVALDTTTWKERGRTSCQKNKTGVASWCSKPNTLKHLRITSAGFHISFFHTYNYLPRHGAATLEMELNEEESWGGHEYMDDVGDDVGDDGDDEEVSTIG
jgi:hypothetical protein